MTAQEFLDRWLRGTTCHQQKRSIQWRDGAFVVLTHHSHKEYTGRMGGSVTCETYHKMYNLDDTKIEKVNIFGEPCIKKWTGRWNKMKELEAQIEKSAIQNGIRRPGGSK